MYDKVLLKKQINESFKQISAQDRKLCTNCKKYGHTIKNCIKGKVFTITIDTDKCPLCNDALHEFEVYSKKVQGTRLLNCKQFYHATNEDKKDIFLKMKAKCKTLCKICTSWLHDSSDCNFKGTCKFCNSPHARGACALQSLASCASRGIKMTKLCVQDIPIVSKSRCKKGDNFARVLFDSGS